MCCRSAPCCFSGTWNSHQSIQNPTLLEWIYLPNFLLLSRTPDQKLMKVGHWGQCTPAFTVLCFSEQLRGRCLPNRFNCMLVDTWESHESKFYLHLLLEISTFERELSGVCMVCKYPWHWIFSVQQPLQTLEWRIKSLCHAPVVEFLCICCSYFTSLGLRAPIQSSELSLVCVTSIKRLKPFCVEGKQEISQEGSISGNELTAGPLSSSVQINFVLKVLRGKTKLRESGFLSAAFQRERCKIFVNSWEIKGDFMGCAALCCCIP